LISEEEFIKLVMEKGNLLDNLKSVDLRARIDLMPEQSSVLVIIHFSHEYTPSVIFTKRSSTLRSHAGEISFPGGRVSDQDNSIMETAIRETFEEIGLAVQKEKIIGILSPTNTFTTEILIYPFIAILGKIPFPLVPNEEVEQVIEIPIEVLRNRIAVDEEHSTSDNKMFRFNVDGYTIWGATARILKNLLDLVYN
jgi:8-oxo-dGTP pyrophosphatase MutT (NUDIX family)